VGQVRFLDSANQRPLRRVPFRAGDHDLLDLRERELCGRERETEAGRMLERDRGDRRERGTRDARVTLVAEVDREPEQKVDRDRGTRRRGVVEEVARPRDERLVIVRGVEEACVLPVVESSEDVVCERSRPVEITPLLQRP
jgi:hypothetical protein